MNAAVAGIAAPLFDSEPARFEVEFVMHHDQVLGSNFEISEQVRKTFAAQIVKSLRLDEYRRLSGQHDFRGDAFESAPAHSDAFGSRDSLDCHESGVVTRARVFFAGISQPGRYPLNR